MCNTFFKNQLALCTQYVIIIMLLDCGVRTLHDSIFTEEDNLF